RTGPRAKYQETSNTGGTVPTVRKSGSAGSGPSDEHLRWSQSRLPARHVRQLFHQLMRYIRRQRRHTLHERTRCFAQYSRIPWFVPLVILGIPESKTDISHRRPVLPSRIQTDRSSTAATKHE